MSGLAYLLPEVAGQVGGSIDAWHDYPAVFLTSARREDELIAGMDELMEDKGYRTHWEGT